MTNLLSLPGRYGDTQIDHMEFGTMRELADKGSSRSIVEQVWTAVKDWFCGTKIGEAKECLLKLFSSKTSDDEKLRAFRELKELSSLPYKQRFVEQEEAYGNSIWLFISSDAAIFKHSIARDSVDRDSMVHDVHFDPYHESFFPRAPLASFDSYDSLVSLEDGLRPSSEPLARLAV